MSFLKDYNLNGILADDMGVGDVAALNPGAKVKTPNIDGLAAGGMQFSDAHTASAVCTPTRYSLLTGRYNWRSEKKERVLHGYSRALIQPDRDTDRSSTSVATVLRANPVLSTRHFCSTARSVGKSREFPCDNVG